MHFIFADLILYHLKMDPIPTEEPSANVPKWARLDCIIPFPSQDKDNKLVSPQDLSSWKNLLKAAEIRQHAPILDIAKELPDEEVPQITYHRGCRSIFTMKKALDAIVEQEKPAEASSEVARKSNRQGPSKSSVYEAKCIFCKSARKYLRGQNTRETLTQCSELRADDKVRQCALKKMDKQILAIVSRELVAAEGHYHWSCYRLYTKNLDSPATSSVPGDVDNENQGQYEATEKQAYEELYSYIIGYDIGYLLC